MHLTFSAMRHQGWQVKYCKEAPSCVGRLCARCTVQTYPPCTCGSSPLCLSPHPGGSFSCPQSFPQFIPSPSTCFGFGASICRREKEDSKSSKKKENAVFWSRIRNESAEGSDKTKYKGSEVGGRLPAWCEAQIPVSQWLPVEDRDMTSLGRKQARSCASLKITQEEILTGCFLWISSSWRYDWFHLFPEDELKTHRSSYWNWNVQVETEGNIYFLITQLFLDVTDVFETHIWKHSWNHNWNFYCSSPKCKMFILLRCILSFNHFVILRCSPLNNSLQKEGILCEGYRGCKKHSLSMSWTNRDWSQKKELKYNRVGCGTLLLVGYGSRSCLRYILEEATSSRRTHHFHSPQCKLCERPVTTISQFIPGGEKELRCKYWILRICPLLLYLESDNCMSSMF